MTSAKSGLPGFFVNWVLTAVAVWIAARLVTGIHVDGGALHYLVIAVVLGLVGATVGTVTKFVTFPMIVVTFGLFLLVVNTIVLAVTAWLLSYLSIDGFGAAFMGALIISVVGALLNAFIGKPLTRG